MKRSPTNVIPEEIKEYLKYENGNLIWIKSPCRNTKVNSIAGYKRNKHEYIKVHFKNILYRAHRIIWFLVKGEQPFPQIDHINRDRQDNRIENLRLVTQSENMRNTKFQEHNKLVGVRKRGKYPTVRWESYSRKNGKYKFIGSYPNIQIAMLARFLYENDTYKR